MLEKLKSVGSKVLAELEKEDDNVINTDSGVNFLIDPTIEKYHHAKQHGTVYATNEYMESVGCEVGDTIWFHHFVPYDSTIQYYHQSNAIEEIKGAKVYNVDYPDQIYLIRKKDTGEYICVDDYLFLEPIIEKAPRSPSGLILETWDERQKERYGRVVFLGQKSKDLGIEVGDEVYFLLDADYEMNIDGRDLWRMRHTEIVFKES